MDNNRLAALPAGIFDWLFRLKTLDLANNHLTDLRPRLFYGLNRLESLYLDGQTEPPEQPPTPEELETPETPSDGLATEVASLKTRMDSLEVSIAQLTAAVAAQRTTLEASIAVQQGHANRISALEQRQPEVVTLTRFIPVPLESE